MLATTTVPWRRSISHFGSYCSGKRVGLFWANDPSGLMWLCAALCWRTIWVDSHSPKPTNMKMLCPILANFSLTTSRTPTIITSLPSLPSLSIVPLVFVSSANPQSPFTTLCSYLSCTQNSPKQVLIRNHNIVPHAALRTVRVFLAPPTHNLTSVTKATRD